MEENFEMLYARVIDILEKTDLQAFKQQLDEIKGNTVIVGAGGSAVVSLFASKILNISDVRSSRDLNYMNLDTIDNILVVSYSGEGFVIENLLDKGKNIYLLTNGECKYEKVNYIKYDSSIKKEHSFISLASTLMPMAILYYYYYCRGKFVPRITLFEENIRKMFEKAKEVNIHHNNVYEILSGYDNCVATKFLESTMTEAGIAIPIVHDKYDHCHGRSTISYKNNHGLIYFDSEKELDQLLLKNLKDYYTEIIKIEKYYNSNISYIPNYDIDNDFYATIKSMYLVKRLAENKNMDISKVDYSPLVRKLYNFRGEM